MTKPPCTDFCIESAYPMQGPMLPASGQHQLHVNNCSLAVVIAAKSVTVPMGHEIRVVHVPTGEVVFRKRTPSPEMLEGC